MCDRKMNTPTDTNNRAQRESRAVVVRRSQSCVWNAAALGVLTSADLNSRGELKLLPFQKQEKPHLLAPMPPRPNANVDTLTAELRKLETLVAAQGRTIKRQETLIRALCDYVK